MISSYLLFRTIMFGMINNGRSAAIIARLCIARALLARRLSTGPMTIGIANDLLQADNLVAVVTSVNGPIIKVTSC